MRKFCIVVVVFTFFLFLCVSAHDVCGIYVENRRNMLVFFSFLIFLARNCYEGPVSFAIITQRSTIFLSVARGAASKEMFGRGTNLTLDISSYKIRLSSLRRPQDWYRRILFLYIFNYRYLFIRHEISYFDPVAACCSKMKK
jgi:hypothetical protein